VAGTDGLRFEQRSAAAVQAVRGPRSEDWEESFRTEGTANGKVESGEVLAGGNEYR
jgi:hypothetical protein